MNVTEFPRPPIVEKWEGAVITIKVEDDVLLETDQALVYKEMGHPPNFYFPAEAMAEGLREKFTTIMNSATNLPLTTTCEFKGQAKYFEYDPSEGEPFLAAWTYQEINKGYEQLAGLWSFYANNDAIECYIGAEKVTPEDADGFYGGWVWSEVEGFEAPTADPTTEFVSNAVSAIGALDGASDYRVVVFAMQDVPDSDELMASLAFAGYEDSTESFGKLVNEVLATLGMTSPRYNVLVRHEQYQVNDVRSLLGSAFGL